MPNPDDMVQDSLTGVTEWYYSAYSGLPDFLFHLFVAFLIVLFGRWLARRLQRWIEGAASRSGADPAAVIFLGRATFALTIVAAVIGALNYLGFPLVSLITIFGASMLAVALALQDSLANLASGLLLVTLRPYKVGDAVQIGSERLNGKVERIRFFHTELRTVDNSLLLIPNRDVMDNAILNFSQMEWRRVDMEFAVGYDEDLLRVKRILEQLIAEDARITSEPAPRVAVRDLGQSSVNLIVQPWVRPDDYLAVKYDLTERVKLRFDAEGISLAYPQQMVQLMQPETAKENKP